MTDNSEKIIQNLGLFLSLAATKSIEEAGKYFPLIMDQTDDGLGSIITTLARLKTLDVLIRQAMVGVSGLTQQQASLLATEVEKAVVMTHVVLEAMTKFEAKSLFPNLFSEEDFEKALQRKATGYTANDIGKAFADLQRVLKKRGPR